MFLGPNEIPCYSQCIAQFPFGSSASAMHQTWEFWFGMFHFCAGNCTIGAKIGLLSRIKAFLMSVKHSSIQRFGHPSATEWNNQALYSGLN
jgi:hypothetical protein